MARYRARKTFRVGPYFRNYAVSLKRGESRGGFTSHGFRFSLGPFGRFTYNLTTRRWTWDNPGAGSVSGGGRRTR